MLPPIIVDIRLEHDVTNDAFRLSESNEGTRTSSASFGGVTCRIKALAVARSKGVSPVLLHQNQKEKGASSIIQLTLWWLLAAWHFVCIFDWSKTSSRTSFN